MTDTTDGSFVAVPGSAAYPMVRSERWKLDKLGNWVGNDATPSTQKDPCVFEPGTIPVNPTHPGDHFDPSQGLPYLPNIASGVEPLAAGRGVTIDEESDDAEHVRWESHIVEQGIAHTSSAAEALFSKQPNALKEVLSRGANGTLWRKQYTDPSGNLTFDGEYFYQYDAWNRLVQVNRSGNLTAWRFDKWGMPRHLEEGVIRPSSCGIPAELGALVKHQTYDGVGRLIRTSSPIQAPEGWEFEAIEGGQSSAPDPWFTRSARFFYDGVRRIQEVVTDA